MPFGSSGIWNRKILWTGINLWVTEASGFIDFKQLCHCDGSVWLNSRPRRWEMDKPDVEAGCNRFLLLSKYWVFFILWWAPFNISHVQGKYFKQTVNTEVLLTSVFTVSYTSETPDHHPGLEISHGLLWWIWWAPCFICRKRNWDHWPALCWTHKQIRTLEFTARWLLGPCLGICVGV